MSTTIPQVPGSEQFPTNSPVLGSICPGCGNSQGNACACMQPPQSGQPLPETTPQIGAGSGQACGDANSVLVSISTQATSFRTRKSRAAERS